MSATHCDRCGSPWSNHENCDDDPNAQTRHLQHIEQLQRELTEMTIERDALAERLIEIDEVRKREDGTLYWESNGEPITKGDA